MSDDCANCGHARYVHSPLHDGRCIADKPYNGDFVCQCRHFTQERGRPPTTDDTEALAFTDDAADYPPQPRNYTKVSDRRTDDTLRTRIAKVIGTHEVWQRIVNRKTWVAPRSSWECSCGRVFALKVDYDAHVADVLIRELQPELKSLERLAQWQAAPRLPIRGALFDPESWDSWEGHRR